MSTYLIVRNWAKFQHYRQRNPPWIKLYNTNLEDDTWEELTDAQRGQLVSIWMFACRREDGTVGEGPRLRDNVRWLEQKIGATTDLDLDLFLKLGYLVRKNASESDSGRASKDASTIPLADVPADVLANDPKNDASKMLANSLEPAEQSRDREREEKRERTPLVGPADAEPDDGEGQEEPDPLTGIVGYVDPMIGLLEEQGMLPKKQEPESPPAGDSTQTAEATAREVISAVKEQTGLRWQKPHRHLLARIREGHSVDELAALVNAKFQEWHGTEYDQYLRQVTLFGPDKFEGYLRQGQKRTAAKKQPEPEPEPVIEPGWNEDEPHLWIMALGEIKKLVNKQIFEAYFAPLRGFWKRGPFLQLVATSRFLADHVTEDYLDFIIEQTSEVNGNPVQVEIVTGGDIQ